MNSSKLLRYIKGESSLLERIYICRWAAKSEDNMRELESLRSIHAALAMTEELPSFSTGSNWRIGHTIAFTVFACVAVAVIAIANLSTPASSPAELPQEHLYVASEGCNIDIILPDGSNVTLTSGSRLIYSETEGKERYTKLSGDGFFEVAPNADRPFVVDAGGVNVTVLGTKFNVITSDDDVEVRLETGSVKVGNESYVTRMSPGQKYVFDRETGNSTLGIMAPGEYHNVDCVYLVFDNAPLSSVLARISKVFEVPVIFDIPEGEDRRLSGRLDLLEGFENAISNIDFIIPLSGSFTSDGNYEVVLK